MAGFCRAISYRFRRSCARNIHSTVQCGATFKYEDIYPNRYVSVSALFTGLERYFALYNHERLHQSLSYRTPAEVYFA